MISKFLLAVTTLACLIGCAPISHLSPVPGDMLTYDGGRVSTTTPTPMVSESLSENPDLLSLLDPEGKRCEGLGDTSANPKMSCAGEQKATDQHALTGGNRSLDRAFRAFYAYSPDKFRRNRIQDRLLQVSDSKCYAYLNYLKRAESQNSTWFGSATTILAGAAAVTGGSRDPRMLSGLASIFSGVGAETRQAFFSNLAVSVIAPGIERRRTLMLKKIREQQNEELNSYSAESAVKDAISYHGECHILAGLEEANSAIKEVRNPGIQTMLATQLQINALKKAQSGVQLTQEEARNFDFSYALNGTVAGTTSPVDSPTNILIAARMKLTSLRETLESSVKGRLKKSDAAATAEKLATTLAAKYTELVTETGANSLRTITAAIATNELDPLAVPASQAETDIRALLAQVAGTTGSVASNLESKINDKRAKILKDVVAKAQESTEKTQAAFVAFANYIDSEKSGVEAEFDKAFKTVKDLATPAAAAPAAPAAAAAVPATPAPGG